MKHFSTQDQGFSIIELMVAATIAMFATLVMFQSLLTAEKYKRVTSSGNDSQQSGMMAFDQVSYLVRNAGSGIVQTPGAFNCLLQAFDSGVRIYPSAGALTAPFDVLPTQLRLAPVMAYDGGINPDVLVLMMGESAAGNVADASSKLNTSRDRLGVSSTVAIRPNDFLLFTRYQPDAAGNPVSSDCILTQAFATAAEIDSTTGYITANPVGLSSARYSAPVGAMPATTDKYAVSTLGVVPQIVALGIQRANGRSDLVMFDLLNRGNNTVLAENVMDFQVAYGVDTSFNAARDVSTDWNYFGDGVIDVWVSPTGDWSSANLASTVPAGMQGWTGAERQRRIKAVKIGIITYDTETEKTAVDRTNNTIKLFDSLGAGIDVVRTIGTTPYVTTNRYRTYEFSAPMRNLTSGLSPINDEFIIR
jgi:hypothetical protein